MIVDFGAANAGQCRGGNCDMQSYLKCQNGLGSACQAGKRAEGNRYEEVQQTVQDLTKKLQHIREQKNNNEMEKLLSLGEHLLSLEAKWNEISKWEAEQKPKPPRSVLEEICVASRKQEKSYLARQLDKLCELSTFVSVAQGSYFADPEEFERLRQLMNGQ